MPRKKKEPMADIIQYDGADHMLIQKDEIQDFNLGSQLIVHEGQEAIFFRNGQALDTFGPGRHMMVTNQIPMLEKIFKLPAKTEQVLKTEVYFINTTTQLGLRWGTDSRVRVLDPMTGVPLGLGANGTFNIRISNPRKLLLRIIGTGTSLSNESLLGGPNGTGLFRGMVITQVKHHLANVIKKDMVNLLEIDTRLLELSGQLQEIINAELDKYGLTITEFYINQIILPEEDPNFKALCSLKADAFLKIAQERLLARVAEASTEHKKIEAKAHAKKVEIDAQAEADARVIRARAEQQVQQLLGYTYQDETLRMIGMEAMKNGLGGSSGDEKGGNSLLGDMASLAMGLGALDNITDLTKGLFNGSFLSRVRAPSPIPDSTSAGPEQPDSTPDSADKQETPPADPNKTKNGQGAEAE